MNELFKFDYGFLQRAFSGNSLFFFAAADNKYKENFTGKGSLRFLPKKKRHRSMSFQDLLEI
jgi:hypothetical protein